MDSSIAPVVENYLRVLNVGTPLFAYIGLDNKNRVQHSGGSIGQFGLEAAVKGVYALEHLDFLEGLLPGDDNPVVIENTQFMSERFVNLHLFKHGTFHWVVFIDNTEAGKARQLQQQEQLDIDIFKEARKR